MQTHYKTTTATTTKKQHACTDDKAHSQSLQDDLKVSLKTIVRCSLTQCTLLQNEICIINKKRKTKKRKDRRRERRR